MSEVRLTTIGRLLMGVDACPDCGHKAGAHYHECTVPTCGCDRSRDEFPHAARLAAQRPTPAPTEES